MALNLLILGGVHTTTAQEMASVVSSTSDSYSEDSLDKSGSLAAEKRIKAMKMTQRPTFNTPAYADIQAFVADQLKFPDLGRAGGQSGLARVRFEILPNGKIGDVMIMDSPGEVFDKAIYELFETMPSWSPALSDSTPIQSVYELRLNFRLR